MLGIDGTIHQTASIILEPGDTMQDSMRDAKDWIKDMEACELDA
jgi:hypothetical protein